MLVLAGVEVREGRGLMRIVGGLDLEELAVRGLAVCQHAHPHPRRGIDDLVADLCHAGQAIEMVLGGPGAMGSEEGGPVRIP
jgi:hypothetical protein